MRNRVDILFKLEELTSNGTLATREKRLRKIDTNSTTSARLKDMARFQLNIRGDLELWLLHEDGYASPMNLDLMDPISKLITKNSTLQVEKLDAHNYNEYPSSNFASHYASLPTAPSDAFDSKESELGDEEMARLLSIQLNGMHVNRAEQMLLPPPRPIGDVIARATCSQFAIEGGRSACTSICLYAAAQLLDRVSETPSCITTSVLDGYLQYGTMLYSDLYLQHGDHTSVDDLWNHPLYSDIVQPLQRRTVISGTSSQRSYQECLGEARCYAHCHDEKSVAVILTKPPETVLIICKDVRHGAPWFIFDSHGHQFDNPKKAFVMHYSSLETAAAALHEKFPNIKGLGDTLHAQQMNMFEAHAIVCKPQEILEDSRLSASFVDGSAFLLVGQQLKLQDSLTREVLAGPDSCDKGHTREKLHNSQGHLRDSSDGKPFADAVFCGNGRTHEKLPEEQEHLRDSIPEEIFSDAVSCDMGHADEKLPTEQDYLRDSATEELFADAEFCHKGLTHEHWLNLLEQLRDSVTGELFADPVICDRGHTHERSSIERHFNSRREMKAEEEARLRQKQGTALTAEETCNSQRNFDPTCPLTGEPISEILINNDQCDRMVQLLVESDQIPLEVGELEDWRERRKEKARLAQERRAQVDCQSTFQSAQESSRQESPPPAVVSVDSNTVVVQRQAYNRAGHFHLGVAVALCPSDWERPLCEQVLIPRCSNSCCRTRLQTSNHGACARCTQILCSDCLVFHVKEANMADSDAVDDDHAICPECTSQILRVLGTRSAADPGSDESRVVEKIDETLTQFFASLIDKKAEIQNQVLQYRVHQSYVTDADVLSHRIDELLQTRLTLENQIRQAQEQANAAAKTDHDESDSEKKLSASDSTDPDELRTRISELVKELNAIDWTTEDGTIRGSLLEYQHNEATVNLGVALSLNSNKVNLDKANSTSQETSEQIQDLEFRCAAAMAEHEALRGKGPSNEHDHEFSMKISELSHRYDQLSMELMQAKEELEKRQQSRAESVPASSTGASARIICENQNEKHGFLGLTFAGSLTRIMLKPFTSRKSASSSDLASSTSKSYSDGCSSGDVMASSNQAMAGMEVEEDIELILPALNASTAEIAIADLAAVGTIDVEEVIALPLDLHYPSVRIRYQVLVLRNNLELARLESERALFEYYGSLRQQLQTRVERLEDEVVALHREVACAEATAEQEERLRQERISRRAAAELQRKLLEEERAAQAERLRQEQERLEVARRKEEEATRQSLRGLDLRRCGNPSCGYGPFEKFACNDMAAHNDVFTFIDANGRRQQRKRNECPQCRWTNPDWKAWPKFDA